MRTHNMSIGLLKTSLTNRFTFFYSCKEVDDKTQNNIHEYEYASTNDCVGNEYEIWSRKTNQIA